MSKRRAHYCVNIANRICEYIALGHGLPKALELTGGLAPSIPMFYRWLEEYPEFLEKYRRAREFQAHTHADIILDIATKSMEPLNAKMIPGFRLAVDVFKWNAEMRLPQEYSPKAAQEHKAPPKTPEAIKAEIARLGKELGMTEMPQPGMVTAPQQKKEVMGLLPNGDRIPASPYVPGLHAPPGDRSDPKYGNPAPAPNLKIVGADE